MEDLTKISRFFPRARLKALLLENMSEGDAVPMTETNWEETRRNIQERVTRHELEELRREVQHGFEQIERGEYTEYSSGKEVADRIIAEGLKRVAERKRIKA